MSSYLATAAQVKANLTNIQPATTSAYDEAFILNALLWVSDRIEKYKSCWFEPQIKTLYFDARGNNDITNNGRGLFLRHPLLEITTITLGDATSLISTQYVLTPKGETPYFQITIKSSEGSYWTNYTDDYEQAIAISGVWGYRKDYASAWVSSGILLNGAVNNSVTSITVDTNTTLSPGMLLKIDTEYLRVTAVPTATTATVIRGQNGSTPASHLDDAPISYWTPEPVVVSAASRWATYLISRRGSFEQSKFDVTGAIIQFPPDMPGMVKGDLDSFYKHRGFYAI
jgi:hypothetical protein